MLEQYFYCCKEQTNIQFCYLFCPCCSRSSASECDADRVRQRWDEMNIVASSAPADAYLKKLTNPRGSMKSSFFLLNFLYFAQLSSDVYAATWWMWMPNIAFTRSNIKRFHINSQHISLYFAGECIGVGQANKRTSDSHCWRASCILWNARGVVARWVCE